MNNENDFNEFDDLDDTYATITMVDENGEEVDFLVISSVEDNGVNYLLVMESNLIDDEDAQATILKEISEDGADAVYAIVEDDDEFFKAVGFFQNSNDDYEIEI